jgi:hypothetical protein
MRIDLKPFGWNVVEHVLRLMLCGEEGGLLKNLGVCSFFAFFTAICFSRVCEYARFHV